MCTGIEENEGQSLGTHTLEAVMCEMQHAQWEFAFVARKEGMNTRGGEVLKGEVKKKEGRRGGGGGGGGGQKEVERETQRKTREGGYGWV